MTTPQAGSLAVDNGHLAYEARGAGQALVFLHGFSFDMRSWDAQVEALSGSFRVIRHDLRGFGRSSLPQADYDHCADLARLLSHLGVEKPVLVGLSLGANVALRYATLHPGAVSGLVLASPGLPGHVWCEPRPPEEAIAFAREHGVEAGKAFWLGHGLFASLSNHPEALAAARRMVADYSGWHWRETDRQAPAAPILPQLETLDVPTLVLSGDRDAKGYREIARVIAGRVPDAELMIFPTAGHMLNLEEPEGFTAAVRDFALARR